MSAQHHLGMKDSVMLTGHIKIPRHPSAVVESLLCTRSVSKFLPYRGSHVHDVVHPPPPQHQPLKPEDFQQEGNETTLKDLCPSPLHRRKHCSVPQRTSGPAASLCAAPEHHPLLSSLSPTSTAPKSTSTIYLEFHFALFRCIS